MKHIEVGTPACLPLGVVKICVDGQERICLFGASLQHPPTHIYAQRSDHFVVTGARADVAIPYVERYCNANGLLQPAEIEVELAAPAHAGLGSKPMLGMAMAKTVAWINTHDQIQPRFDDPTFLTNGLGIDGKETLYQQAALTGGLLLVDSTEKEAGQALVRRIETDTTEKNAWAFVLVLPRPPADTPDSLEEDRLNTLLNAAANLDKQNGILFDETIWPAIEQDDLETFGDGLMQLQQINQAALGAIGQSCPLMDWEQSVLQVMADNGAVAWGRSLTGYGLFAITRDARATINMRVALRGVVPHEQASMIATIVEQRGMTLVEKEGKIKLLV
ncbi:hypothetical protein KFU94_59060 [Chloroflexi bacterium TSY]|nr:hypothetical protein [Chloroflexi bacterium TSY]